jgi:hypothetical protein
MKHAWGCLLLVACGGTSGEPMKGSIAFTYGTSMPKMAVGAAVEDKDTPGHMLVQMGDNDVDCGTDFNSDSLGLPTGNFVFFSVDATTPAADPSLEISVVHFDGRNLNLNGSTGMVTIDTVMPRVTGSLTFNTTDSDIGTISVSGNFDIKRCF